MLGILPTTIAKASGLLGRIIPLLPGRPILLSAALIFIASSNLQATEALIFNGGGYNLYILVGYVDEPVIGEVRFTPPEATDWVDIPRELLQIKKFDMEERILDMRFSNRNNPDLPSSFSLSVKKNRAVLTIIGKQIRSSFNWDI